ncbi:MAG: WD40 repeat domain-containing protein [Gemmatimonadota bacterium]|nr:WD40 repeat domain-containing protein [Gemmatimonadota bacterium]
MTSFAPVSVAFHPTNTDTVMVLTDEGRIDIIGISDTGEPIKKREIPGRHQTVAFSPNGARIVSTGPDGTVRLWELDDGRAENTTLGVHHPGVASVAFSPDGARLVSGGLDGEVRLWTVENGTQEGALLHTHPDEVLGVAFSPDGTRILSGGLDGTVQLWDANLSSQVPPLYLGGPVEDITFNPDASRIAVTLAFGSPQLWSIEDRVPISDPLDAQEGGVSSVAFSRNGTRMATGGVNGSVRLWDVDGATAIGPPLEGNRGPLASVAFSPDGTRIVSAGRDGTLRFWSIDGGAPMGPRLDNSEGGVARVGFSFDGTRILSTTGDGIVRLWEPDEGTVERLDLQTRELRIHQPAFSPDGARIATGCKRLSDTLTARLCLWTLGRETVLHTSPSDHFLRVSSVALSSDGRRIVSGDVVGDVRLWDVVAGAPEAVGEPQNGHTGEVMTVAFSGDDRRLISGGRDGTLRLWEVDRGQLVPRLKRQAHEGEVTSLAFNKNGGLIVSSGWDGAVRLWSAEGSELAQVEFKREPLPVTDVAFSHDGGRVVSARWDGAIRLWAVEGRELLGGPLLQGHGGRVTSVRFSPDGNVIVSAGADGTVRVWAVEGGRPVAGPFEGGQTRPTQIAFSPDNARIVSGDEPGALELWVLDGETTTRVPVGVHEGGLSRLAFSPDGVRIASGGVDGTVRLWTAEGGGRSGQVLGRHALRVTDLAFSPDGKSVVSVGAGDTARLWRVAGGPVAELTTPDGRFSSAAFSADGDRVALGAVDGTVHLWAVEDGRSLGESPGGHSERVTTVVFGPEGQRIVSGSADGTVRLWELEGSSMVPGSGLLHGHVDGVASVAFSPDGQRVASIGSGALRLWHAGGDTLEPLDRLHYVGGAVRWLNSDVVAVDTMDRVVFFDRALETRGELFLTADGLVAIAGHGVYASPLALKDHVLAFRGPQNLGAAESLPLATMRGLLFDDWSIWAVVWASAMEAWRWARNAHEDLGNFAGLVWVLLSWLMVALPAITMWVFCPARLAWRVMSEDRLQARLDGLLPFLDRMVTAIALVAVLGNTRRALTKWLQENRGALEQECFTGRAPVRDRNRYWPCDHEDAIAAIARNFKENKRVLVWIDGVGGSGKSALAMHVLRSAIVGRRDAPVPVLVGEDWDGSLASQVARQLRHRQWTRGPSEAMVKVLGACGLICPLVDSLSERTMDDAWKRVSEAIGGCEFRHVIVTSRERRPAGQVGQAMGALTPPPLQRGDVRSFIEVYVSRAERELVEERLGSLVSGRRMPSPLFLRFAIAQAKRGSVEAGDRETLVLEYVEGLRVSGIDIDSRSMRRAACAAAIACVQEHLRVQEVSGERLETALAGEGNVERFLDRKSREEVAPVRVLEMLERSGLLTRGRRTLQFNYEPVAEHLAAWGVKRDGRDVLGGLRERLQREPGSAVGRVYRGIAGGTT